MSDVASLFLKLTGKTPGAYAGESEADGYEGQIEIDDWSWSLTRPASTSKDAARATNAAEPSLLTFGKLMCKASANMLQAMLTSELLTAVITLEEDSDTDFELVVTLEGVRINDYKVQITSSETGGKIDETWELDYSSVRFDYVSAGSGGKVSMNPPLDRPADAKSGGAMTGGEAAMREVAKKLVEEKKGDVQVGDLVTLWKTIVEEAEKDYKTGRVKPKANSDIE